MSLASRLCSGADEVDEDIGDDDIDNDDDDDTDVDMGIDISMVALFP